MSGQVCSGFDVGPRTSDFGYKFGLTLIPDGLVLMMLGVLLGPGLGLARAGTLAKTANLLGTLAIILCFLPSALAGHAY